MKLTYNEKQQTIRIISENAGECNQLENVYVFLMRAYKGAKVEINTEKTLVTIQDNWEVFKRMTELYSQATTHLQSMLLHPNAE